LQYRFSFYKQEKEVSLLARYFPVFFPFAVAVLQARADTLHVAAGLADGEPLPFLLEEDHFDRIAAALPAPGFVSRGQVSGDL
jgi:hypothetical protein